MSLIIIDDKYYKAAIQSLKSKLNTDKKFNYQDFPVAVDNIPSSADGTDNPIIGIYFLNPNENGYPTKIKVSGFSLENKETAFPLIFNDKIFRYLETVEFLNCDFKYLQDKVFQNCQSLINITIPNCVTSIGNQAFFGCTSLSSITIPDSVTSLGSSVFYDCINLISIAIPEGISNIGYGICYNCKGLKTITIPNSVKSINSEAFLGCSNLEFVELGQSFNANNLNLSVSTKYSRETILQWLNALADRTGQTAYKLIIGRANLNKLTEEDIAIATAKNWTLS